MMSQLVNPHKWNVWDHLYDSDGPEGEMLIEYAEKEWKNEPHIGETPPQIIEEVREHGRLAVEAIEKAAPHIEEQEEEFSRLQNDIYCYQALSDFFDEKVKAAMWVLRYGYSQEVSELEKAVPHLEQSVAHFQKLVDLTKDTYLYANSMQTAQRRIPIGGDDGKHKTWEELLPHYQEELKNLKRNISQLKSSEVAPGKGNLTPLKPAQVELLDSGLQHYAVEAGSRVFTDESSAIKEVAAELKQLKGIRLSMAGQQEEGTRIRFRNEQPVKVLVGYFQSGNKDFLAPPDLETDAMAQAQGQAEVRIANAVLLPEWPPVNVHTYYFDKGENTLALPKGACLVLGFAEGVQDMATRDAGLMSGTEQHKGLDWLFD